jgi:hypothetical protein
VENSSGNLAVCSVSRDRLSTAEVAPAVFPRSEPASEEVHLGRAIHRGRTLIQAWASQKSFRPKDGDGPLRRDWLPRPEAEWAHECTTDPDAQLHSKSSGEESKQWTDHGCALCCNRWP